MEKTLGMAARLRQVMTLDPARNAFDFNGTDYTWGQVQACFAAVEAALARAGASPDAAIGCALRNRPAHLAAALAVLCSGRCVVTINPFQGPEKVARDIRELRVPVLIADSDDWAVDPIREVAHEIGALGIELGAGCGADTVSVRADLPAIGPGPHHDPLAGIAILMLTSGTTGPAKRVPLAYSVLERNMLGALVYEGGDKGEVRLRNGMQILMSPMVHIGGFYTIIGALLGGRGIAILEKFTVPSWHAAIKRHKPKAASLPPSAMQMVYDANIPREDLACIIAMRTSTAPLSPELHDAFEARYGIPILNNYGATELGGVAGWTLADYKQFGKAKRGSVGRAEPGCDLRVVDRDSGQVLAPGAEGLLEVRTRNTPAGEWIRTTDLAVLDADGFLFLRGRADDAIIRGGFKVLPGDIAKVLMQHPAVQDAAVVGIADARLGAVPVAAVEVRPGMPVPAEAELIAFVRERVVAYQVPVRIRVVDELPRTPSLKISQPMMRELFAAEAPAKA